jgi:hypothetical protein
MFYNQRKCVLTDSESILILKWEYRITSPSSPTAPERAFAHELNLLFFGNWQRSDGGAILE